MKLLSTLLLLLTLASCGSGGGGSSSAPNTPFPTPPVNPESLCHPYKEIVKYVKNSEVPLTPECGGDIVVLRSGALTLDDVNGNAIFKEYIITETELMIILNVGNDVVDVKVYENVDGESLSKFIYHPPTATGNSFNNDFEVDMANSYLTLGWVSSYFGSTIAENTGDDLRVWVAISPFQQDSSLINENITLTIIDTNEDIL